MRSWDDRVVSPKRLDDLPSRLSRKFTRGKKICRIGVFLTDFFISSCARRGSLSFLTACAGMRTCFVRFLRCLSGLFYFLYFSSCTFFISSTFPLLLLSPSYCAGWKTAEGDSANFRAPALFVRDGQGEVRFPELQKKKLSVGQVVAWLPTDQCTLVMFKYLHKVKKEQSNIIRQAHCRHSERRICLWLPVDRCHNYRSELQKALNGCNPINFCGNASDLEWNLHVI